MVNLYLQNDLLFLYEATLALACDLAITPVPMVLPEFEGLGPTVHTQANGSAHAVSYIRSRSPSSIEDLATPEMESMCPNGGPSGAANGSALQENYRRDVAVGEDTKLTAEFLEDLLEEDEDLEEEDVV